MSKKFLFLTAALLAVIFISGCSGGSVRGNTWPGLNASAEAAYLADGPFVYAVNLKDGSEIWRYPDKRDQKYLYYTTPYITSNGLVIVGGSGSDSSLVALDPTNVKSINNVKVPAEAWKFSGADSHWVAAPLEIGEFLYAPNSDGNLYVLNLSNGQLEETIPLSQDLWSQPVTDGKYLYISSLDHSLIAVDKDTYKIVWHEDLGSAIASSPIIAPDGSLYVGSFTSNLEKFDPSTGNHQAVEKTNDWVWGSPSVIENNLYFGDLSGNLYSYNLEDGKYNWTSTIKPADGSKTTAITASPLVVNDVILVATESGAIYDVDQSGKLKNSPWATPGGKIYTTPVIAGDLVLVSPMTADAYLYAYDLNGRQVWAFNPES